MHEIVPQDVDLRYDAFDAAEYLHSLGQDPPKVNSLEQAVEKIIEIQQHFFPLQEHFDKLLVFSLYHIPPMPYKKKT